MTELMLFHDETERIKSTSEDQEKSWKCCVK